MGSFLAYLIQPVITLLTFMFGGLFRWIAASLPILAGFLGSTVVQVLISAGWGFTSFIGFDLLTSNLIELAVTGFGGIPGSVAQLLGVMWFDKAVNLVLSTATALMVLKGVRGGKKVIGAWSAPGSKEGGFLG